MQKIKNKQPANLPPSTGGLTKTLLAAVFIFLILAITTAYLYERKYSGEAYPNVYIGGILFAGKTAQEIENYWLKRNELFQDKQFVFKFEQVVATVSAASLNLGYDATLSATQALLVGRSAHIFHNFFVKFFQPDINLNAYFRFDEQPLLEAIVQLSQQIDIPVQDALFRFEEGRVTAFRPSRAGRQVNQEQAKEKFFEMLPFVHAQDKNILEIILPVDIIEPEFTTDEVNSFGVKELIGSGYSEFTGSIPGRIHNVLLAASRINGILIKPGEVFSLIQALGDISAATGYQSAYIIKDGRTVLGDGGGVCQVSTTLFRAALNAGLVITQRHPHAYRVHYYEEAGEKPGIDATVFAPSVDLKFKNDTPGYILIQTKPNLNNLSLTFELYGTSDRRVAQILNHVVGGITPPPPPLYQDDPTLPQGTVRQVDWAAWGAKTSFRYLVTKNGETLQDTVFASSYRPWQAVYLRGTK